MRRNLYINEYRAIGALRAASQCATHMIMMYYNMWCAHLYVKDGPKENQFSSSRFWSNIHWDLYPLHLVARTVTRSSTSFEKITTSFKQTITLRECIEFSMIALWGCIDIWNVKPLLFVNIAAEIILRVVWGSNTNADSIFSNRVSISL